MRRLHLRPTDAGFVDLVRRKLAIPGNDPIDISETRGSALRLQLRSQLKPVLRTVDLASFDLDRAFQTVADVAARP